MTNKIPDYIQESLANAGFSSTYYTSEPDRLHEYTRQVVGRHLAEFYAIRFDLNGSDVYTQIENYLDHVFRNVPLDE